MTKHVHIPKHSGVFYHFAHIHVLSVHTSTQRLDKALIIIFSLCKFTIADFSNCLREVMGFLVNDIHANIFLSQIM